MKESIGGILNVFFLIIFLIIVEGILALIVSYTKAFRMKNAIISAVERYEGNRYCFSEERSNACWDRIEEQARKINYSPNRINCPTGFTKVEHDGSKGFFCWKRMDRTVDSADNFKDRVSYRIITQVDIDIPIIGVVLGFDFFQVTGDTRWIITPTVPKKS